jgi:multiple sugar transport system substrate-binding protein
VGMAALSACGAAPQPAAQQAGATAGPAGAAPSKEPVTIRFHARIGAQEDALYDLQMPKFMEANPNIKLVKESFPGAEFAAKVSTMQAGGTLGDVVWSALGQAKIQFAYAQGTIQPIDELIKAQNVDVKQWYEGCLKGITVDGKLLGLPFKAHPGLAVVYYNSTAFEAANTPLPKPGWTLDDQLQTAKALTKVSGDKVDMFGYLPNTTWKGFVTLFRANGTELLSEDGKTFQFNSDKGMQAIQWLYDLFHTHKVAPTPKQVTALGPDANAAWTSGKLAMYQGGTSVSNLQNTIGDKFKWMAIGNGKGPAGVGGSDYEVDAMCVTSATKNPNEAFEWLKYLCNQDSGVLLGVIGGTVGGRPDVYNSPVLLRNEYRKVFKELMDNAQDSRITANWRQEEAEKALDQLTQPLWAGDAKPDKATIDSITTQIQDIMNKPKP